jgi:hypothetical protein
MNEKTTKEEEGFRSYFLSILDYGGFMVFIVLATVIAIIIVLILIE